MGKLKAAYIVDDCDQHWLVSDLIDISRRSDEYEISLLIVQSTFRTDKVSRVRKISNFIKRRGVKNLFEKASATVLLKVEGRMAARAHCVGCSPQQADLTGFVRSLRPPVPRRNRP